MHQKKSRKRRFLQRLRLYRYLLKRLWRKWPELALYSFFGLVLGVVGMVAIVLPLSFLKPHHPIPWVAAEIAIIALILEFSVRAGTEPVICYSCLIALCAWSYSLSAGNETVVAVIIAKIIMARLKPTYRPGPF